MAQRTWKKQKIIRSYKNHLNIIKCSDTCSSFKGRRLNQLPDGADENMASQYQCCARVRREKKKNHMVMSIKMNQCNLFGQMELQEAANRCDTFQHTETQPPRQEECMEECMLCKLASPTMAEWVNMQTSGMWISSAFQGLPDLAFFFFLFFFSLIRRKSFCLGFSFTDPGDQTQGQCASPIARLL